MGVKKHVFGRSAERTYYYKLSRQWGQQYRLHHNLPFLNVFDTSNLIDVTGWPQPPRRFRLTDIEFNRLKKTSIDYTLCDEHDIPLVCLEYDGMQEGFNVGTSYRSPEPSDPWRDEIMSLKLRVAHGSQFPYFVLGSRYLNDLSARLCTF